MNKKSNMNIEMYLTIAAITNSINIVHKDANVISLYPRFDNTNNWDNTVKKWKYNSTNNIYNTTISIKPN